MSIKEPAKDINEFYGWGMVAIRRWVYMACKAAAEGKPVIVGNGGIPSGFGTVGIKPLGFIYGW